MDTRERDRYIGLGLLLLMGLLLWALGRPAVQ